ncbi:phosphopantothenate--cysteine ligase isoform X2 [Sturnira hondurensis]|uniref:phosphopantothenate--cysteine ligase isoform X2 n=1 Tax=Sturnira hondurensis TaxID=192404 RepID=UPI00187A52D2|nr:phosphopantothenate--cysteine ligase isoform X2 [Sturnira hondurensis]
MAEADLVAEFPQPAGAARSAEALRRCFTWLRPCRISMFLSLKCLNTRSSHLGAHCRCTLEVHKTTQHSLRHIITMKMVPKMLSPLVKDWAPKAFVISFKLETDPSIVIDRARNALEIYRHQVVVANILESRQSFVVIITKDSETKLLLSEEDKEKGIEIEKKIVDNLQSRHTAFIQDNN